MRTPLTSRRYVLTLTDMADGDDADEVMGAEVSRITMIGLGWITSVDLDYDHETVYFVGEGNFSFAIAFAALRRDRCWELTKATILGDDIPEFHKAFADTIRNVAENDRLSEHELRESIKALTKLNHVPPGEAAAHGYSIATHVTMRTHTHTHTHTAPAGTWSPNIDATALPDYGEHLPDVVWFQCPWDPHPVRPSRCTRAKRLTTPNPHLIVALGVYVSVLSRPAAHDVRSRTRQGDPAALVTAFLESARDRAIPTIVVGVTKKLRYSEKYQLGGLGIFDGASGNLPGYTFVGGNEEIVKKVLAYGYKHEGYIDIHDYIYDEHVLLIWTRDA
jgi:hypothetical protein